MSDFISLLQCPISGLPIRQLSNKEVVELNQKIDQGGIVHSNGKPSVKTVVEALKVEGKDYYYPVLEGILCLLPHLVLVGTHETSFNFDLELDDVKQQLKDFYDEVGWHKEDNHFVDANDSEDLRPVSREYIRRCHERVKRFLKPKGKYLLDVASGPIQYPEYLSYSEDYEYRICADISLQGLREAKKKLKDKGIYVLCDMTHLPFQANTVDGCVSLHTIYHIPKDQQAKAIAEIYRVLREDSSLVVVYSWGNRSLLMNCLMLPWKVMAKLKAKSSEKRGADLYFYAHGYRWFTSEIASRYPVKLKPWRSVNVPFLKKYVHGSILGKWLLKFIYRLEEIFPKAMARIGAYPMMVIEKKRQRQGREAYHG